MTDKIVIEKPLVSIDWLWRHFDSSNLIILDASIQKVSDIKIDTVNKVKSQIKNARFFDLKKKFSDLTSEYPTTMPSSKKFSDAARQLGINRDSAIVVYDELGIYSSPRVWWMFKAMGHDNIAVLDGGLPEWEKAGLPIESKRKYHGIEGNFTGDYHHDLMSDYKEVFKVIHNNHSIVIDARAKNRFNGTESEPRVGLRSGHIPNSINLPYTELIKNNKMITEEKLSESFSKFDIKQDRLIFTCGSGITACILALGSELAGLQNIAVYDGSWTEWGSLTQLPIEK